MTLIGSTMGFRVYHNPTQDHEGQEYHVIINPTGNLEIKYPTSPNNDYEPKLYYVPPFTRSKDADIHSTITPVYRGDNSVTRYDIVPYCSEQGTEVLELPSQTSYICTLLLELHEEAGKKPSIYPFDIEYSKGTATVHPSTIGNNEQHLIANFEADQIDWNSTFLTRDSCDSSATTHETYDEDKLHFISTKPHALVMMSKYIVWYCQGFLPILQQFEESFNMKQPGDCHDYPHPPGVATTSKHCEAILVFLHETDFAFIVAKTYDPPKNGRPIKKVDKPQDFHTHDNDDTSNQKKGSGFPALEIILGVIALLLLGGVCGWYLMRGKRRSKAVENPLIEFD